MDDHLASKYLHPHPLSISGAPSQPYLTIMMLKTHHDTADWENIQVLDNDDLIIYIYIYSIAAIQSFAAACCAKAPRNAARYVRRRIGSPRAAP